MGRCTAPRTKSIAMDVPRVLYLLAIFLPSCLAGQPTVTWQTNLTVYTAAYQQPQQSQRPLGPNEAHTWCITDMPRCKGPLVIEFWEDHKTMAEAVPLLHGASLCPVLADKSYAHFNGYPPPEGEPLFDVLDPDSALESFSDHDLDHGGNNDSGLDHGGAGGNDYPTAPHSYGGQGGQGGGQHLGSDTEFGSGVQWDAAACGLQLPYHWIIKYWQAGDGFFDTGWWVHVMNLRNTTVPEYRIRATCVMPPEKAPCPDPTAGPKPCSGHGQCALPQPSSNNGHNDSEEYEGQPGVCECQPGWVGVGCQVPTEQLPLWTPTRAVGVYNPDAKLVWNSTLNTPWSLLQIKAPPTWQKVVVEAEVDWSSVAAADIATLSQPRLCWSPELTDDVVLRKLRCLQPLSYPLAPRTGFTVSARDFVDGLINVVVADVGQHPVTLVARPVAGRRQDGDCPFNCSGLQGACNSGICTCSTPGVSTAGTADRDGSLCQYLGSTVYPGERERLQLTLPPGQGVQWVLQWMPRWQSYDDWDASVSRIVSQWKNGRPPLKLCWEGAEEGGLQVGVQGMWMEVDGTTAGMLGDNEPPRPRLLCSTQVQPAAAFDSACPFGSLDTAGRRDLLLILNVTNTGTSPVSVNLAAQRLDSMQAAKGSRDSGDISEQMTALAIAGPVVALTVIAAVVVLHQRRLRQQAALRAAQIQSRLQALLAARPTRRGVPEAIKESFVTYAYGSKPPAVASVLGPGHHTAVAIHHLEQQHSIASLVSDTALPPEQLPQPQQLSPVASDTENGGGPEGSPRSDGGDALRPVIARGLRRPGSGVSLASDIEAGCGPSGSPFSEGGRAAPGRWGLKGLLRPGSGASLASREGSWRGAGVDGGEEGRQDETLLGKTLRRMGGVLSGGQSELSAPAAPASTGEEDSCPICLLDYEAGDRLRCLPCRHAFHQPCVDAWMEANHTCPVCRLDLLPPSAPATPHATDEAAPAEGPADQAPAAVTGAGQLNQGAASGPPA